MELMKLVVLTVSEHNALAQQLEAKYQQHLIDLMAAKAAAHQEIQLHLSQVLTELRLKIQNNNMNDTTSISSINHHNDTDSLFSAESLSISGTTNIVNMEYIPHQQPLPILEKDGNNTKVYDEEENECNIDDMMNNKNNNNNNNNKK